MAREDEQADDREQPGDLGSRMEAGFALLHGRIDRLDSETKADLRHLDGKIDGLRLGIEADLRHLDGKLNALIAAMIVGVLTLIGAGITAIVGI